MSQERSDVRRWWQLVRERFPPGSYLPMVVVFVLANAAVTARATTADLHPGRLAAAFAVALSFFLRLRLFDELKDHEVDLAVNPTRPLARGLVAVPEVKRVVHLLAALELLGAGLLGWSWLVTHAAAVLYSYLMYREFFLGAVLRPLLTTYAVTHTLVSVLLGYSVAAALTDLPLWELPRAALWFGPVNWMLFNLFEFARKTFAPTEERADVPSYSKLFGPRGATALALSQVLVALLLLLWLSPPLLTHGALSWHAILAGVLVIAGLVYALRPARGTARLWRGLAGAYILAFFASIAFQLLG